MNPRLDITTHLSSGLGRAMLNLSSEAEARLERPLFELVKIRASQSTVALIASICTRRTRALPVKRSSASTPSMRGARRRSSPIASAPRSNGPRP
jgi:hypothetical protein